MITQAKDTVDLSTYRDFFFSTSGEFQGQSIFFLFLGGIICFLYVAFNKYYFYFSQVEIVDPESNLTKKKFENLGLIKHLRFKSIIFSICFAYGLISMILFFGIVLLDHTIELHSFVSEDLLISTGERWLDGIIGGLVFGAVIYPVLSSKLIGTLGFEWLVDLFANPNDKRILDEISFARYLEINSIISSLKKKASKKGGDYTINEFGNQLITWNDHLNRVDDGILLMCFEDAKQTHDDHLVNISLSMAKTIGYENIRMALKYPIYDID